MVPVTNLDNLISVPRTHKGGGKNWFPSCPAAQGFTPMHTHSRTHAHTHTKQSLEIKKIGVLHALAYIQWEI